jgi:aryl-alcohol dehydrogenase-like predicted oxidoreductase
MIDNHSGLTLGTAQLGLEYGIANKSGKPDCKKSFEILEQAFNNGILYFDTAHSYGESETIIGSWKERCKNNPFIITKIPRIDKNVSFCELEKKVNNFLFESMNRLRVNSLWGLMLHSFETYREYKREIIQILVKFVVQNLVCHIGVSVYAPDELKEVASVDEFDIFQAPINIFDSRWNETDFCVLLKKKYFFARSIYLQGLLLLDCLEAEKKVSGSGVIIKKFERLCNEYNLSKKQMAMAYVKSMRFIYSLVVGVETPEQILENIQLYKTPTFNVEQMTTINTIFTDTENKVINPSLW